jgi:hypothetical protein
MCLAKGIEGKKDIVTLSDLLLTASYLCEMVANEDAPELGCILSGTVDTRDEVVVELLTECSKDGCMC